MKLKIVTDGRLPEFDLVTNADSGTTKGNVIWLNWERDPEEGGSVATIHIKQNPREVVGDWNSPSVISSEDHGA